MLGNLKSKSKCNYKIVFLVTVFYLMSLLSIYGVEQKEITVSNTKELEVAIEIANDNNGNFIINLEDGTYDLNSLIHITKDHITIKSKSNDYNKVTIQGSGMNGEISHVFLVAADNFYLEGVSLGNVANHGIQVQGENGADNPIIKNCRFFDTNEQMLKISGKKDDELSSKFGIVENCLFEYTKGIGPQWYIGGIDGHNAENWTVTGNTFKYIRSPESRLAEHAIHFWSNSKNTVVEKNTIIDCDRGIGFGLGESNHFGGIIRNNFVHTTRDVGIGLENSAGTKVYNNTVYTIDYANSIEYRFSGTRVDIRNNLTNANIKQRDNGVATLKNNVTNAKESWFFDAKLGDLHLRVNEETVVNKGEHLALVNEDIDGETRLNGTAYDIGGDEVKEEQMEPSSWAKESIDKLKANNTIEQSFFGNYQNYISRTDFAYLAVKLYETLSYKQSPSVVSQDFDLFTDTNDNYVIKAYKLGIINGYGNQKFGPEDLVTREQIDVMLIKTLSIADIDLSKSGLENINFKDQNQISSWALESVRMAYKHKIMKGVAELTIAPKNNTTREQALFLVQNILDNKNTFVTEKIEEDVVVEAENTSSNPVARITLENNKEITIELYPEIAPNTVNNFINLSEDGFYDGLIFHRVISGFIIQGGDPTGTGTGGPGYKIEGEFSDNSFSNQLSHTKGVISMARSAEHDSGGSQFFIMLTDELFLDGKYAGFGKVVTGMENVDEIASVETNSEDKPILDVVISKIVIDLNGYIAGETIKVK